MPFSRCMTPFRQVTTPGRSARTMCSPSWSATAKAATPPRRRQPGRPAVWPSTGTNSTRATRTSSRTTSCTTWPIACVSRSTPLTTSATGWNGILDRARSSQGVQVQLTWTPSQRLDSATREALALVRTSFTTRDPGSGRQAPQHAAGTYRGGAGQERRALRRGALPRARLPELVRLHRPGHRHLDRKAARGTARCAGCPPARPGSCPTSRCFAAAAAFYDTLDTADSTPLRLVLLDEAFERVDDPTDNQSPGTSRRTRHRLDHHLARRLSVLPEDQPLAHLRHPPADRRPGHGLCPQHVGTEPRYSATDERRSTAQPCLRRPVPPRTGRPVAASAQATRAQQRRTARFRHRPESPICRQHRNWGRSWAAP